MDGLGLAFYMQRNNVADWLLANKCPVDGDTWLYSHVYGSHSNSPEELRAIVECTKIASRGYSLEIAKIWTTQQ